MCLFLHKKGYDTWKTSDNLIEESQWQAAAIDEEQEKGGSNMRIGTYNMLSQIYGNTGTKKPKSTGTTSTGSFLDQVSFSSMGKDMQTAKTALGNTPDVRESKIQDLKRRIDNGTYDVSVDDFAQKLLDSYSKANM